MDLKDYLTNEDVSKKFKSQFELVNYAIQLAANMIHTGRESRVKIDSQNRAMHVLTEILQDKDRFDEVIPKEAAPAVAMTAISFDIDDEDEEDDEAPKASKAASKGSKESSKATTKAAGKGAAKAATDKKKPRKILSV